MPAKKPRTSKPKVKSKEGFQKDERIDSELPFGGDEKKMKCSGTGGRTAPLPQPQAASEPIAFPQQRDVGCPKSTLCVHVDPICREPGASVCGMFRDARDSAPTTAHPADTEDSRRRERVKFIGTATWADIEPLLNRAAAAREAREVRPRMIGVLTLGRNGELY